MARTPGDCLFHGGLFPLPFADLATVFSRNGLRFLNHSLSHCNFPAKGVTSSRTNVVSEARVVTMLVIFEGLKVDGVIGQIFSLLVSLSFAVY
jgi:hypothetical protein